MQLPFPWRDIPKVESLYSWFFDAFSDLSTCRAFGFTTGPIPWRDLTAYVREKKIEDAEMFEAIIREMDSEYLLYVKEEQEKDPK